MKAPNEKPAKVPTLPPGVSHSGGSFTARTSRAKARSAKLSKRSKARTVKRKVVSFTTEGAEPTSSPSVVSTSVSGSAPANTANSTGPLSSVATSVAP